MFLNSSPRIPGSAQARPLWLRTLPWALLLAVSLRAFWLRCVPYPGWASLDEEDNVRMIQWWREGMSLQWRFWAASLHRALLISWGRVFGFRLVTLQLFCLATVWAE